jgi:hypothetical protein
VDGRRTVQKAFEFPYHSPRWQLQDLQPMTEQFGGKILSDDGKTAYLNSPETLKALTLWRDVTKECGDPKNTKNTASNPNRHLDASPPCGDRPLGHPQVTVSDQGTSRRGSQVDPAARTWSTAGPGP